MSDFSEEFLRAAIAEFQRYKNLGDGSFAQLEEADIHRTPGDGQNSIAILVKHMAGNMKSRWTNFLQEDGEKSWRDRENEFRADYSSKAAMIQDWEAGWQLVFDALDQINAENFGNLVTIRGEAHSVIAAVNRQLGHYAYHSGQIVFLARTLVGAQWESLSIPRGGSEAFNRAMARKFKKGIR